MNKLFTGANFKVHIISYVRYMHSFIEIGNIVQELSRQILWIKGHNSPKWVETKIYSQYIFIRYVKCVQSNIGWIVELSRFSWMKGYNSPKWGQNKQCLEMHRMMWYVKVSAKFHWDRLNIWGVFQINFTIANKRRINRINGVETKI